MTYSRQWYGLRFRTRLLGLVFVLYIPAMALGVFLLNSILPGLGNRDGLWLFIGWGLIAAVLSLYQISFRCPGCGGWFGSGNNWTNPFARHCMHCGLVRYANPSEPT